MEVEAEDREAPSVISKECVSDIDVPFTRTVLRREGMSGTILALRYSEEDKDASELNLVPSIVGEESIDDGSAGHFR
jgi:hypothetical protein